MKIVILGAGFGGVYVARQLAREAREVQVEITLVNSTNYFLFTPLLHEVATGGLGPMSVSESLREIFAGTRVRIVRGAARAVDLAARTVDVDGHILLYDRLVVATGAETEWFGVPGAEERTLPLKNLEDAMRIRGRIIGSFERAALAETVEERRAILSVAVVGGGATGVELAAELTEFAHGISHRYHQCGSMGILDAWKITLINAGPELLAQFHPSLRASAAKRLRAMGVELAMGVGVTAVEEGAVVLNDGRRVTADSVIWTAGVRPRLPTFTGAASPAMVGKRLAVDHYLHVQGFTDAFALGDSAAALDQAGKPVPMLAQVAVAQAAVVAKNIIASLRNEDPVAFTHRSKGSLVSLGQWYAVGEIFFARFSGRLAWWIWRTIYLFKFLSWRKRIRIAFEWTLGLFYSRDVTE